MDFIGNFFISVIPQRNTGKAIKLVTTRRELIQLNSHDGEEREHSFSCIACCKLTDTQSEFDLYKRTIGGTIKKNSPRRG